MKNITNNPNIVINIDATIKQALKNIDESGEGLLLILDNKKFLGTVSDGDLRRAIIEGNSLNEPIRSIYNNKSYYVLDYQLDHNEIKKTMMEKRYRVVPVINNSQEAIGYITWDDVLANVKWNRKHDHLNIPVVVMAGGKGTRMAPFTNVLPKPLVPIGEKTILELIIDEFLPYGIKDYYFTINYRGEMIRAYFDCIERDYIVNYLKEDDFYGTAGSLNLLPKTIDKTFVVTNCDIIVKADFADVLDFHKKSGAMLTVLSSIQHHKIPYGVIKYTAGGIVTGLEEKPEMTFCINTGVYILEPECLKYIPEKTMFHMTHLIEKLMSEKKVVATYPVNESEYIDIGQWEEYRQALKLMEG